MDKDFDYNEFQQFMQHLSGFREAVDLEQRARTFRELEMIDDLEGDVAGRLCYNSVEEMMQSIKEM